MFLVIIGTHNHQLLSISADTIMQFISISYPLPSDLQYELHTMLCFDEWQNGIPGCWALTSGKSEIELTMVLTAMKNAVEVTRESVLQSEGKWCPSSFLVDCADEEANALRYVQELPRPVFFHGHPFFSVPPNRPNSLLIHAYPLCADRCGQGHQSCCAYGM